MDHMKKTIFAIMLASVSFGATADVLCQAKNGIIFDRAACRKNETQIDLTALGLKSASGCPATLDGNYSGTATRIANIQGQQTTIFQVLTATLSGNQTQINAAYDASLFGTASSLPAAPPLATSYNKDTCVVTIQAQTPIIGVVSDGGRVIHSIQGSTGGTGSVYSYTLYKQ